MGVKMPPSITTRALDPVTGAGKLRVVESGLSATVVPLPATFH
jgi:hypothetical protein